MQSMPSSSTQDWCMTWRLVHISFAVAQFEVSKYHVPARGTMVPPLLSSIPSLVPSPSPLDCNHLGRSWLSHGHPSHGFPSKDSEGHTAATLHTYKNPSCLSLV